MSLVSGFQSIKIPFILTGTQPNGAWVGNNTPYTTINRGTYIISLNPRALPFLGGGDTINAYQMALSINAPFNSIGSINLAASPSWGANIGLLAGNSCACNLACNVNITDDNTNLYVYINITTVNAGGWVMNSTLDNPFLNDIQITRIA